MVHSFDLSSSLQASSRSKMWDDHTSVELPLQLSSTCGASALNFVNGISYMTLLIGIFVRCVSALQKKSTFLLNGRSRNIGKSSTLWWRWVIIIKGSHSGISTIYIPSLIQWSVVSYNINDKTIVYPPVYMLYLPQNIQQMVRSAWGHVFCKYLMVVGQ